MASSEEVKNVESSFSPDEEVIKQLADLGISRNAALKVKRFLWCNKL